jgi:3-dehydroquinate dehydratase-1
LICVSLRETDLASFVEALKGIEFAEIRMDGARLSSLEIRTLFSKPLQFLATYRPSPDVRPEDRLAALSLAARSGARFVDLELDAPVFMREALLPVVRASGCRLVVSHHDERGTPGRKDLDRFLDQCFAAGGDIAKIACRVHTRHDVIRLLSLYDRSEPIIALGMGRLGTLTRIAAPLLGAPFTYASLAPGRETADGQLNWKTLRDILKALGGWSHA